MPTAGIDAAAGVVSVTARRAGMVLVVPAVTDPVRVVLAVRAPAVQVAPVVMAAAPVRAVPAAKAVA